MLAYQIRKNCENEMYAQNTVKPNESLPRSWSCSVLIALPNSPLLRIRAVTTMSEAWMHTAAPAKIHTPKMVEYHSGLSDMTQSNAANVRVRPNRNVAAGAMRCAAAVFCG